MPHQRWETDDRHRQLLGMQGDENDNAPAPATVRQRLYALLDAPDVAERGLPGCVITEYQRCNKAPCRCQHGLLHGPYYYAYGRLLGVTWTRYLRREEAPRVVALCRRHREQRWTRARSRAVLREFKRHMRLLDGLLDDLGW